MPFPRLLALALLTFPGASTPTAEPPKVVVLDIDLNNIHKTTPDSSLGGRPIFRPTWFGCATPHS